MLVIAVFLLGIGLSTNESGNTYFEHYFETGKQLVDKQRKLDSLESDSKTSLISFDDNTILVSVFLPDLITIIEVFCPRHSILDIETSFKKGAILLYPLICAIKNKK